MTRRRTAILLGAGASVDAGLPTSVHLTKRIAEFVDKEEHYGPTAQALHMAIGAMIAHATARGHGAYEGLDVERLFSAVQMLAERDDLDVAPFVAAWNTALERNVSNPRLPGFWGDKFKKSILAQGSQGVETAFQEGVNALTGPSPISLAFRTLRKRMIGALRTILAVPSGTDLAYLTPLMRHESEAIVTLNYDRCVETVAEEAGIPLDTGAALWRGGFAWHWNNKRNVRLLKVHGSIDWFLELDRIVEGASLDEYQQRVAEDRLGVVFGHNLKLRPDGPFLAMLVEFDRILTMCDRLVVIGYSFRDDHVNSVIDRWLRTSPSREIVVINPSIETWNSDIYHLAPDWYKGLYLNYLDHSKPLISFREGLTMASAGAKAGIADFFSDGGSG